MATITKLQTFGNGLAVVFSDGSRVLAQNMSSGLLSVPENGNGLKRLQEFGNQIALVFEDGTRVLAYPSGNDLWYVGPNEEPTPPDLWVWPLAVPPWSWSDEYGMRTNPVTGEEAMHWGIDINGGGIAGTAIRAASRGTVRVVNGSNPSVGYGYYVHIQHPDGSGTFYAHMQNPPPVSVNDVVDARDVIGFVGTTGSSTGNHLHFNTQSTYNGANANTNAVNPRGFMSARGAVMP